MKIKLIKLMALMALMCFFTNLNALEFLAKINYKNNKIMVVNKDEPYTLSCDSGTLDSTNKTCYYQESKSTTKTCPNGYYNNGNNCYQENTVLVNKYCPSGYINVGDACFGSAPMVTEPCRGGYTFNKWNIGYCTDSNAFVTYDGASCGNGETSKFDGVHYSCIFLSPVAYIPNNICSGSVINGACVNTSNSSEYIYNCNSGYTISGTNCYSYTYTHKIESCDNGYLLSGNECTKQIIAPAIINCPSSLTYNSEKDICTQG